jgi:hypothetical protein
MAYPMDATFTDSYGVSAGPWWQWDGNVVPFVIGMMGAAWTNTSCNFYAANNSCEIDFNNLPPFHIPR